LKANFKISKLNILARILLINIIIFLVAFLIFFGSLNFFLGGVPQYSLFNLEEDDILNQKRILTNKFNLTYPDEFYYKYFSNYYSHEYFLNYKKKGYSGFFKKLEGADINYIYQTDIFGNRENLDTYYLEADIVLLGDSYLSVAINQPFDVVSQFRNLTNSKILNLGLNGSGPFIQYLRIKFLTKNTNYHTLIFFFYEGNDHQETSGSLDKSFEIKEGKNYDQFNPFNSEDFNIKKDSKLEILILSKIFLAEYLRGAAAFYTFFKIYPDLLNKEEYENILRNTKYFLDDKKISKRYIYYVPKYTRHALHKINSHPQLKQLDNLKESVKSIAENNDFKFIDGNEAFKDVKNPLNLYHYEYPTHFNALGHKLMGEHLNKIITNN
jgi:hypothetical protein